MKREKQPSLDFIRAVSIVAIVLEHYSYSFLQFGIPGEFIYFLKFENGDWGGAFVAVFFMLSGAALIYNYPTLYHGEVKPDASFKEKFAAGFKGTMRFYWKRLKALFPLFYVCWLIFYILTSKAVGIWNWGGDRINLLYTVFGVDGYFLHRGFNYFCVGEWFLGAILFLYLLYPFLRFAFMKFRWIATVLITALFSLSLFRFVFSSMPDSNIFIVLIKWYDSVMEVPDSRNLFTCIMYFWTGMLLITYRKTLINIYSAAFSVFMMLVITLIPLPFYNEVIMSLIGAVVIYLLLAFIAPYVLKYTAVKLPVGILSTYSYGIFLIHHQIMYLIMPRLTEVNFTVPLSLVLFVAFMGLVTALSWLLTTLVNHPVKSFNNVKKTIQKIFGKNSRHGEENFLD